MFNPYVLTLLGHVTTTLVLLAAVKLIALAHAGFGSYQVKRLARRRTP
ncbi:hypothetical protein [Streptomyces sp. NPDC001933]